MMTLRTTAGRQASGRPSAPASRSRAGFTLVELLTVLGIIAVLISLLVPVVSEVRKQAYKANTGAQINSLRMAIEAYQANFRAYPGPLDDNEMYVRPPGGVMGFKMTMGENLVLGLLGGLTRMANGMIVYDPQTLGLGPQSLSPSNPKRYAVFYEGFAGQLSKGQCEVLRTAAAPSYAQVPPADTNVPEFLDRYPEGLPILYLRARSGAPGIMSFGDPPMQYDMRQYLPYVADVRQSPPAPISLWGVAQYGYYPRGTPNMHGLYQMGDLNADVISDCPNDALPYFRNPTSARPIPMPAAGTPRAKDGFILISAGNDRKFGTDDDLVTFGSVLP